MDTNTAYDQINALLPELNARHPRAKITFGYIGNWEASWPVDIRDQRLWMFFINEPGTINKWSWGDCKVDGVPSLLARVLAGDLDTYLNKVLP